MPHAYAVVLIMLTKNAEKFHQAEMAKNHNSAIFHETLVLGAIQILYQSDPPHHATRNDIQAFIHQIRETKKTLGIEKFQKHIKPILEKLEKHFAKAS